jgi:hypothetical protein
MVTRTRHCNRLRGPAQYESCHLSGSFAVFGLRIQYPDFCARRLNRLFQFAKPFAAIGEFAVGKCQLFSAAFNGEPVKHGFCLVYPVKFDISLVQIFHCGAVARVPRHGAVIGGVRFVIFAELAVGIAEAAQALS